MRKFFIDLDDTWHEIRVEPEAYFDLGEHTLLYYVGHAQGRQSGAEVAGAWAQVCRWRDGLCAYCKGYVNREDALRDLGVSEEVLEALAP